MIGLQKALELMRKKKPERTVTQAFNYQNTHYIFVAPRTGLEIDYNDPYFAVDRSTGDILSYSPADDLENWIATMQKGELHLPL